MTRFKQATRQRTIDFDFWSCSSVRQANLDGMGNCDHCGSVFHWGRCGTWENGKHTCTNCSEEV